MTHMCGAPVVLNLLLHAPDSVKRRFGHVVEVATGGAAPPSAVIEGMSEMGFNVTHLYGLTETYGPATVCAWQQAWDALDVEGRAGTDGPSGSSLSHHARDDGGRRRDHGRDTARAARPSAS